MAATPRPASPAVLSGRYTIERELGRGGMATVFLARELKHDRRVALKLFEPDLATALDAERFLREVQITAGLQHPHIVPLLDSGEDEGRLYYVMPFVEGESLRERLLREPQLPIVEALRIACEVTDALEYAHARGVVHRDIKPGNILLTGGHAVVADFGIARACAACAALDAAQLTLTGLPMGTPAYMSPEQATALPELDGRSDLYSLGCVLYEMLAGRPPFTGATITQILEQHRSAEATPIRQLRPEVPPGVARVLRRTLAKAPAQRYPSAGELLDDLRREVGTDPQLGAAALAAGPPRDVRAPVWSPDGAEATGFRGLLAEVKRRKVFRAGAVYAVVGWSLIQGATATFPYLGLPPWMVTAVIVLVFGGFPVVLVLAWAYDLTPSGPVRAPARVGPGDARTAAGPATAPVPNRRALAYTGVGILIALAGFGLSSRYLVPRDQVEIGAVQPAPPTLRSGSRSIAVLPFANLSTSKENEYFSDGITDDVLTALATLGDLRVISRTSAMQYKGTTKPLRQIARELGVETVLEGSVRRQGSQVRVTAQLIDARSDEHIWAQTYDRKVEDIFRMQSEIARDIAAALQARLTPEAERRMAMAPTQNLTAYDLYLQGQDHFYRATAPDNTAAIRLFRQALALDSSFALARAELASAFTIQTLFTDDRRWLDSAGITARRALVGHEDLAEAQGALGLAELYAGHLDRALDALGRAIALKPNFPLAVFALARAEFERGGLAEALRGFRKVAALEPTTAVFMGYVATVYQTLGRYDEALAWHQRAKAIQPDYAVRSAVLLLYLAHGQPDRAAAEARAWLTVARDSGHALLMMGLVDTWGGNLAGGRRFIDLGLAARPALQAHAAPALAYIALRSGEPGRAAELIRDGRAALQRLRSVSDFPGDIDWFLAELDALEGSRRGAVEHLQAAYEHGFRTVDLLRHDPMLASLRGDPDFERLVGRMQADVDRMWRQIEQEGG